MLKKILKWLSYFALFIFVILITIYIYLASIEGKKADDYAIFAEKRTRPLVIAHRGGKGIAPENTLEAFRRSNKLGVDVLELDIHATKDGEFVVLHDKSVNRTTNGKGLVAEMTLNEIRELDAGFNWTNDEGKTFPFRDKGIKIPTLREVFEEFPNAIINIESKHAKPSPVKPLCDLIKEFKRTNKSIFASFHKEVLQDFRQNCSDVATSASPSESTWFLFLYKIGLSENYKSRMQALQIPQKIGRIQIVTDGFADSARERNLQLHVWTINKKEDMQTLINTGVDGIMTDYPDKLIEVLDLPKN